MLDWATTEYACFAGCSAEALRAQKLASAVSSPIRKASLNVVRTMEFASCGVR